MIHIPQDVLIELAQHLDLGSARNLSRTCKSLRDAGEVKVWEHVDVTSGWNDEAVKAYSDEGIMSRRERTAIVERKLSRVFEALKAYPVRKQYVKELRVEPSDGVPAAMLASLARLLRWVAPRLRRLDIIPLPGATESRTYAHSKFTAACHSVRLPRLTHLKLAVGADYDIAEVILPWKMDLPMLQSLEFGSSCGSFEGDPWSLGPRAMRRPFPLLNRLTFDHLSHEENDQSLRLLAILLRLAPNLAELRLRGGWIPQSEDAALRLLRREGKLDSLQLFAYREPPNEGGIDFSEFGTRRLPLKVKQAVVEIPDWREVYELRFERLYLPRSTDLTHLTIITGRSPSMAEYAALPVGHTPEPIRRIHPAALRHFDRTPSLSTIQLMFAEDICPSLFDSHHVAHDFFVLPHSWVQDGLRGAVIREYTRTGEPTLWHLRTLSRTIPHSYISSYVGIRRQWQDWTQFDGMTVPREVLSAVYEAIGESPDFLEGGRALSLGEGNEPWAILREWRAHAGREAEEEDAVSDASADEGSLPDSADESEEEPEDEDDDDYYDPYGNEADGYDDYDSDDPMGDGNTEYAQEMYDHYGLGIASGPDYD